MDLADQIEKLQKEIDALKDRLSKVEKETKEEREVKQVVFDKEGSVIKVRRKVLVKTARGLEEKWEEVTSTYKPEIIGEVMQND